MDDVRALVNRASKLTPAMRRFMEQSRGRRVTVGRRNAGRLVSRGGQGG